MKESFADKIKPVVKKKKVTLYLETDLAMKFKVASARVVKTQSAIVEELIKEFLKKPA